MVTGRTSSQVHQSGSGGACPGMLITPLEEAPQSPPHQAGGGPPPSPPPAGGGPPPPPAGGGPEASTKTSGRRSATSTHHQREEVRHLHHPQREEVRHLHHHQREEVHHLHHPQQEEDHLSHQIITGDPQEVPQEEIREGHHPLDMGPNTTRIKKITNHIPPRYKRRREGLSSSVAEESKETFISMQARLLLNG